MSFFRKTVKGLSWMGALRVVTRGFTYARTIILARLLVPAQFGVFGVASLALGFLEVITETGVNVFLIQEKAELKEYVDTAWLVSILRGILIFLMIFS